MVRRQGLWRGAFAATAAAATVLWWVSPDVPAQSRAASGTANGEWRAYHGDYRNHHYSALSQIDASNFNSLEVAWRFRTDSLGNRAEYKLEDTPLMVGGVLYTTAGTRRAVIALDAGTGELRWVHGEPEGPRGAARRFPIRSLPCARTLDTSHGGRFWHYCSLSPAGAAPRPRSRFWESLETSRGR